MAPLETLPSEEISPKMSLAKIKQFYLLVLPLAFSNSFEKTAEIIITKIMEFFKLLFIYFLILIKCCL